MKLILTVEDNEDGTCDIEISVDPPAILGKPIETQAENIAHHICTLLADLCEGVEGFSIGYKEDADGEKYH